MELKASTVPSQLETSPPASPAAHKPQSEASGAVYGGKEGKGRESGFFQLTLTWMEGRRFMTHTGFQPSKTKWVHIMIIPCFVKMHKWLENITELQESRSD